MKKIYTHIYIYVYYTIDIMARVRECSGFLRMSSGIVYCLNYFRAISWSTN